MRANTETASTMTISRGAVEAAFRAAMADNGIEPHSEMCIAGDGQIHRFRVKGDRPGTQNGWYVLYIDNIPSGAYGSWRDGATHTWCAHNLDNLSPTERVEARRRALAAQAKRDRELKRRQGRAAERAAEIWQEATAADPSHPYLRDKKISAMGARQKGHRLVLPVTDVTSQNLSSLQFIDTSGTKTLLAGGKKRGCVIHICGQPNGAKRVLICEGFATGVSLAGLEPESLTLAAIDAGNLQPVATATRQAWPGLEMLICSDSDPVGREKGRAAAIEAGALIAIPDFPPGIDGSDWNDYVNAGLATSRKRSTGKLQEVSK